MTYSKTEESNMGECALCLEEKELRDSHIVSKFNFKPLKENDGRFFGLSTRPDERPDIMQDGPKEELLCDHCEGRRGRWEDYFSRRWRRGDFFNESYPFRVEGLDYSKVRLHQLATLFMASISTHAMFEKVDLSAARKETLRQMIDSGDPGAPETFGCVMNVITSNVVDARKFMIAGTTLNGGDVGGRIHRLCFGGFFWLYLDEIQGEIMPDVLEKMIQPSGEIFVDHIRVNQVNHLST